jgi:hypothetical protein
VADNVRPTCLYQIPILFSAVVGFLYRKEGPSDRPVGPKVLLFDPQPSLVGVPAMEPSPDFEVDPRVKACGDICLQNPQRACFLAETIETVPQCIRAASPLTKSV